MIQDSNAKQFTKLLLQWHQFTNNRDLPWKNEKNPYKIWLSEIILQQTRALQGLPYYLRFIVAYPHITDLATAPDEQVFRLWQGLGYYNRCKNMLATARYIVNELNGIFPDKYEDILQLKGIGAYTAAAIASFAYGLPNAVVDGNVYRVLSRYFGIDTPFDTTEGKKQFAALAQSLIDVNNSAGSNQAIMDLGATICLPRQPQCNNCPLEKNCIALLNNLIPDLPIRSKTIKVKNRYFNYLLILWDEQILLHKRNEKDIWQNLHEPFLIETYQPLDLKLLPSTPQFIALNLPSAHKLEYKGYTKQKLTHQLIEAHFFTLPLTQKPIEIPPGYFWQPISQLDTLAFPNTLLSFFGGYLKYDVGIL